MRYAMLALGILAGCSRGSSAPPQAAGPSATSGNLVISGPFVHENLALYVVEDPKARGAGEFITLDEGLKSGAVKVTEKESAQVNELLVENGSDKPCFVQAGDVVKGGQQDRTIAADFVIPPRSGRMPIPSFCVESGRWTGHTTHFATYTGNSSKELRLAAQLEKDQGKVWESVAKEKRDLTERNALSLSQSTSVNEERENSKIRERRKAFLKALGKVCDGRPQAVGIVSAIGGKLSTADLYADPGLFRKLFVRLIDTAALEAIAQPPASLKPPSTADVAAFLARAEEGQKKQEKLREGLEAWITDGKETADFRCRYNEVDLHRQAIAK